MKINEFIKKYDRIFIDISTLLNHGGQFLLNELSKYDVLDFNGANHIIITNETAFALTQDSGTTKVHYLLKTLQKMNQEKIVQFKNFSGEPYQIIFDKFIQRYSLALITNDNVIANQVIEHQYGPNSKQLGVFALNNQIQLESYIQQPSKIEPVKPPLKENEKSLNSFPKSETAKMNVDNSIEFMDKIEVQHQFNVDPFSKKFLINPIKFKGIEQHDIKLNHELPSLNDHLTSSNKREIKLTAILSEKGGEGVIYFTNIKGYVCKIYRKETLTAHKYEKLELLISKPLDDPRIAYPKELVFFRGKFVGYIMPQVAGHFVGDFMYGKLSVNKFKNWSRLNLIELCISILSLVCKTHEHGMLIGDVNRGNFMVESPTKVYMVDVDSSQVEKYPCPVGVEEFTPPEIIDGEHSYKEFFRTYENEYYSLSVLIFMILMLGAATTTQLLGRSSMSKIQKIKAQDFGFTLDEEDCKKRQNPINFAIWSRFPSYIKEAFYQTFHKRGKNNKPKDRLSPQKWLELLKSYRYHFTSGKFLNDDSDFHQLIPSKPVSFKSMLLEPSKFVTLKISSFSLSQLLEDLKQKLKSHKYKKTDQILRLIESKGEINSENLKLKVNQNLGFMIEMNGLILLS